MEREKSGLPPQRELVTIAGEQVNILSILKERKRLTVYADKMKPGDDEAMRLFRIFTNIGVTPEEYITAMPNFFQLAAKKEGGFDADFLIVTEYLMKKVLDRRGGERNAYYSSEQRLTYFADVYGQMQALKDFVWRFPELADHKRNIIEFAKKNKRSLDLRDTKIE